MSPNGEAGIRFLITQEQMTWKATHSATQELDKDIRVKGLREVRVREEGMIQMA